MSEIKELSNYDLKRVLARVPKEFGVIERGTEENYNPQIDYVEKEIYRLNKIIPIHDFQLQKIIGAIIYDLKGYIENRKYDYSSILSRDEIKFAQKLEKLFNPFTNKEIKVNELGMNNLKELFTLPIIILHRLYDSIEFWRNRYGKDGYYRMLEEYVMPIMFIGKYPYALQEIYLD